MLICYYGNEYIYVCMCVCNCNYGNQPERACVLYVCMQDMMHRDGTCLGDGGNVRTL